MNFRKKTPRGGRILRAETAVDWEIIREAARAFSGRWKDAASESAEAQSFWNDFFAVFGRTRRGLALYEYHARRRGGLQGRIDLLWPGVLAVEHKSRGGNLDAAQKQLEQYINELPDEDKPAYGLVCDFQYFRLTEFANGKPLEFSLADLHKHAERFQFFIDHQNRLLSLELKASHDAAEKMGGIYDAVIASGYTGATDRLLIRLLFCMFAEDTGIFTRRIFMNYIHSETRENGADLGMHLQKLFETLNTEDEARETTLPPKLGAFPHVNGDLFSGDVIAPSFDRETRAAVLDACAFDWSEISPAIFGSLFQSVKDKKERRAAGAHYTSEENILKIVRPLFLDELAEELNRAGKRKTALQKLHDKIAGMRFLDPACGCGNFLIIAYRELRRLEIEIIARLNLPAHEIPAHCRVSVASFYGIEIDPFPAQIAQAAMWLVEHQMNMQLEKISGCEVSNVPLRISAHIAVANALSMKWEEFVAPENISYILGNPPFVDRKNRTGKQRQDMLEVFGENTKAGNLDYVSAWYVKTLRYIRGRKIKCALVSTDSITQSMQAAVLWKILYAEGMHVHFAYRSFKWFNEAPGVAKVHVVIIGFGGEKSENPAIYAHSKKGAVRKIKAQNISAYITGGDNIPVPPRRKPLCGVLEMVSGSNPIDGGHLLLSAEEKHELLKSAPAAAAFLRPVIGGEDYLNNTNRWCIWLADSAPSEFKSIAPIMRRVRATRKFRKASGRDATSKLAKTAHVFGEIRQPNKKYLVIPQTSSGERPYIPMGYAQKRFVALIKCQIVPGADLFHFGVLTSAMHMAWVRAVGGRLGTGYSYTASLVYNTFPWPETATAAQKKKIAAAAQAVLAARKMYNTPMGELYSNMPKPLLAAHQKLDAAVDRAYRAKEFRGDDARRKFLFAEYKKLTAPARAK